MGEEEVTIEVEEEEVEEIVIEIPDSDEKIAFKEQMRSMPLGIALTGAEWDVVLSSIRDSVLKNKINQRLSKSKLRHEPGRRSRETPKDKSTYNMVS